MSTAIAAEPTSAPAAEAGESHLTAADKFFAPEPPTSPPTPTPEPAKAAEKPAEPPVEKPAPVAVDPLAKILKVAAKAPVAAELPSVDEIDRGLQAPPESSKSRAGWDELKKRASDERKLRLELEQKLKARDSKGASAAADEATLARLAELEQQNRQYSERLKVLDLKSHPEFTEKYLAPANRAKAALGEIAKSDELELDVEELVGLKGKALNTAVSGVMEKMTPYARVRFQSALDSYFSSKDAAEKAVAEADQFLSSVKKSSAARSRASFDAVAGSYRETFLPAEVDEKASDADKKSATTYNEALAGVTRQAEQYAFDQIDEQGAADLAHKAALYEFAMHHGIPRIASMYGAAISQRDSRISELEEQVKALTAASPRLDGGSGGGSIGDGPAQSESHLDAARRYFQR